MTYYLPDGYQPREVPERYQPGPPGGRVWQPDVYPYAAELARLGGSVRLVDVGCSTAAKLQPYGDEFDLIGVDLPGTPAPDGVSMRYRDLDAPGRFPVAKKLLAGSVLVCSDVIEHLVQPEYLVAMLVDALGTADALVLSTPDRARTRGPADLGPPRNPCHVREWNADELVAFLADGGLNVVEQFWQRSNDHPDALEATTVIVATA